MSLTPQQVQKISVLTEINRKIDELKDAAKEIESWLRNDLGNGEHEVDETTAVKIKPQLQFSQDQARAILPPALLKLVTHEVIDPKLARKILPAETVALCLKEVGQPTVKVVINDD